MMRTNKQLVFFLSFALAAAIVVMAVLTLHYVDLGRSYNEKNAELQESRETWESIAAEKEALQEELSKLQSDLREADLSYSEARERSVTLQADIDELNAEISSLHDQIASLQ